jgi:hypothetical protein
MQDNNISRDIDVALNFHMCGGIPMARKMKWQSKILFLQQLKKYYDLNTLAFK